MKKIFLFCIAIITAMMAQAYTEVTMTFKRTGTTASTVTCTVADENGTAISGASATVTCNKAFKSTANAVTSGILCPNVNANTSPTITLGIKITGLSSDFSFNQTALDIHALNSSGYYQESADNVVRQWNVAMTANSTAFGSLNNIDIAAGVTAHHKEWTIKGSTVTIGDDGTLNITLTITKGTTNKGCFFGLSSIKLTTKAKAEPQPDPCPSLSVITIPCTTLSADTYLSRLDITGVGAVDSLHYISGTPTQAYNLYTKKRATLMRGFKAALGTKLVGKSVRGLTVALYADYDGDGKFEDTTTVADLTDSLTFTLQVPYNTTSSQGRLRVVLDQSGSEDPDEAYGTVYDLPFYIKEPIVQATSVIQKLNDGMLDNITDYNSDGVKNVKDVKYIIDGILLKQGQ